MEHREAVQLFEALERLCLVFGRQWTESLGEAYLAALKDEPGPAVLANCRASLRGDRMPLPRDLMASATAGGDVSELEATRAWEATRPCFARHAEPSDPIAAEVVTLLGGSAAIGAKDSDDVSIWVRKEFIRLYQERAKIERRDPVARTALPRGSEFGKLSSDDFRTALNKPNQDPETSPRLRLTE
jgi:hypothetical protein